MNPKHPRTLTDGIVERLVSKGGEFSIVRDQYSHTQGPGGVDVISVTRGGREMEAVIVPRTDSIPQREGPEKTLWRR